MRLSINPDVCTGHGLCYADAPGLVVDDDQGYGQVIGDGTVPAGEEELARHLVANCPEGAVSVVE